uniref:Uncharacterized protein n=1 Tax=Neogobius melanostomus TaxID=47308 RepID=A0A8C6S9G4_9GOBI
MMRGRHLRSAWPWSCEWTLTRRRTPHAPLPSWRHRFSFDGGDYSIFQSHSYPRRARTRWHRSTNQLNTEPSPLANRKVTFSSTEWMLESTV